MTKFRKTLCAAAMLAFGLLASCGAEAQAPTNEPAPPPDEIADEIAADADNPQNAEYADAQELPYTDDESITEVPPREPISIDRGLPADSLAGFVEIAENMLTIRPMEVFVLYDADAEFLPVRDPNIAAITFVERQDAERFAEFGLDPQDDFPGWHHIRQFADPQAGIPLTFEITDETIFQFVDFHLRFGVDPYGSRLHITHDAGEFLQYLYPTVVHFIEVYDGRVIRVIQEFAFTV